MNTHADKTQENKSQAVSAVDSQMQSGGEATFQFVDNRPEAIAQRKLQEMANNSAQVSQLKAFQDMANNSPQGKQTTQLQEMADNHSAQQQQPIQKKENNTGLPDNLKTGMENLSGMSLDDVKVHRNSDKPAQLQAHAYAQGTDIHIGPGQEKHLPHEAWHVVQQKQGRVKPTMQMKSKVNVNDDTGLENEADVMGARALAINPNFISNKLTDSRKATNFQNPPAQLLMDVEAFKEKTYNSARGSRRAGSQVALIDTLLKKYHAIDKSDPNTLEERRDKLEQLNLQCDAYFTHKIAKPGEEAESADGLNDDRVPGIKSLIGEVKLEEQIIEDSIKLNKAQKAGELDKNLHHGTSSAILGSFGGELLSQKALDDRGIVRRTGEGSSLSGQDVLKDEVFVGMGKGGGGASAAYARAGGKLPEYNMDLLSDADLIHEISQLQKALENKPLGETDDIMDRLTKASKGTDTNAAEVSMGLGGGAFNDEVLQSELNKYLAEQTRRSQIPLHARQSGGYPILFEFENPGNVKEGNGQVKEGIGLGSVDMRGHLKRAFCPVSNISEFEGVLANIFPNDNYQVLALESYDNLPKETGNGGVMWSTFNKIKKSQTKMKVARDAQAL